MNRKDQRLNNLRDQFGFLLPFLWMMSLPAALLRMAQSNPVGNMEGCWMETGQGRCVCGSVELTLIANPIIVHGCHCRYCQRMTGSVFAINIMIERSAISVSGELELVPTPSTLPKGQLFARCARCRIALWSHHPGLGEGIAFVSAGVLDNAERYVPDVHCHTACRHPWVRLSDDRPKHEGDYDTGAVWSPQMHRRISARLESGNANWQRS